MSEGLHRPGAGPCILATDDGIAKIDAELKAKEAEVMAV